MAKEVMHPELLLEEYGGMIISPLGVKTSDFEGPMTLIKWINEDEKYLNDSFVLLKKINSAIAWLLIKGKVKEVYTNTLTYNASNILNKYDIKHSYEYLEDKLDYEDLCMWEKALLNIDEYDKAIDVINECSNNSLYPHVND